MCGQQHAGQRENIYNHLHRNGESAAVLNAGAVLNFVAEGVRGRFPDGESVEFAFGVVDENAAKLAEDAGMRVVMDRCVKIELFRPFWKPRLNQQI